MGSPLIRSWIALALALLVLTACQTNETRHTIEMTSSNSFSPASLVVSPGSTLVWHNLDHKVHASVSHPEMALHEQQAVSDAGGIRWDSGDIPPGATWSLRVDEPGIYLFVCPYHDEMRGMIIVDEAIGAE